MLPKTFTLFLATVLTITVVNAKIWRVNNNVGVVADFTTAQAAHNAANVGDTLHFESSTTDYGALEITKRLVIIGLGEFLASNPGLQFAPVNARLTSVRLFRAGANGTVITGIRTDGITLDSVTNGATITSCYASNILIRSSPNTIISRNFIQGGVVIDVFGVLKSTNCIVNNNITGPIAVGLGPGNVSNGSASITNNTIHFPSSAENIIASSSFSNNIISGGGGSYHFFASTVNNNVFAAANYRTTNNNITNTVSSGNGNLFSVTDAINYVGPYTGMVGVDSTFKLKTTSPALTAGVSGVQCGAFGNVAPYRLGLQPAIPSIYQLVVPGVVGNNMNVTISTKSN